MKKGQKVAVLAMSGTLLVAASVMGTMAYLQDKDTVTNTFTVGKVDLILNEAKVNLDGTYVEDENGNVSRVKANEYHLLPGHTYQKDPTVTIQAGSEDCYVRMMVEVQNIDKLKEVFEQDKHPEYYGDSNVFLLQKLVGGWNPEVWIYETYSESENGTTGTTGTYEFRYAGNGDQNSGNGIVIKSEKNTVLDDLFTSITIPGEGVTNENIGNLAAVKIVVTAHAIQADGFDTDDKAWGDFDNKQDPYGAGTKTENQEGSEA